MSQSLWNVPFADDVNIASAQIFLEDWHTSYINYLHDFPCFANIPYKINAKPTHPKNVSIYGISYPYFLDERTPIKIIPTQTTANKIIGKSM
jgi:hypothetical protein